MGAYLSEPITEKISSEGENEVLSFGASSMQGWRISQEDAHNAILDFDKGTSFWAVYDGHGGSEVSAYCALKLPDHLKQLESYKGNDMEKALKELFIEFDQTLLEENIIEELKQLAKKNPDYGAEESEVEDEENIANLCQEARMPLKEVLERYKEHQGQHPTVAHLQNEANQAKPVSPYLRAKRNEGGAGPSSSSSSSTSSSSTLLRNGGTGASGGGPSGSGSSGIGGSGSGAASSSSSAAISADDNDATVSSSSSGKCEDNSRQLISDSSTAEIVHVPDSSSNTITTNNLVDEPKSLNSTDSSAEVSQSTTKNRITNEATTITNGDICVSSEVVTGTSSVKQVSNEGVSSSSSGSGAYENGEVSSNTNNGEHTIAGSSSNNSISSTAERIEESKASDSSTDDSEDEAYDEEDGEEDPELEEMDTEEDEDEDLLTEEDEEFMSNMIDEPGKDSGCTAVVALLHNNELYVANAGDSRCIVCRKGKTIEMSLDHKPEDQIEFDRIKNAGGRVTLDGRVNGGLNLSRAIGDHGYKMNKDLRPEEQMISALPDVRRLTLSPDDEFMVLACDGIWNFMTSDDVVKFVRAKLTENPDIKLAKICEELFDHCLAPNTMGDGTGCDNMTAIIVKFKKLMPVDFGIASSSTSSSEVIESRKRSASADGSTIPDDSTTTTTTTTQQVKRIRTSDAEELPSSNMTANNAADASIIDTSS